MAGDKLEFEGTVSNARGNGMFTVDCVEESVPGKTILCKLSGKIRQHNIRILTGDKVKVEVSPYDLTKGVIVYRSK